MWINIEKASDLSTATNITRTVSWKARNTPVKYAISQKYTIEHDFVQAVTTHCCDMLTLSLH